MRYSRRTFLGLAPVVAKAMLSQARAQELDRTAVKEGESARVFGTMRKLARSIRIRDLDGKPPAGLLRPRDEPVLRYSDPARSIFDSTLWVWQRTEGGRPMAALKVEHQPTRIPQRRWLLGLVSLAPGKVEAVFHDGDSWTSAGPGFTPTRFPDAPAPASSPGRRLAQARELAGRFLVTELAGSTRGRLTLRLMPRPLLRYSEPEEGVSNGMLFAFAYGTNPDVLLAMEIHDRPEPGAWHYAFGRLGGAEGSVGLKGQTVWSVLNADPPRRLETYMNRRVAEGDEPD